jgi:hypothetical protein
MGLVRKRERCRRFYKLKEEVADGVAPCFLGALSDEAGEEKGVR